MSNISTEHKEKLQQLLYSEDFENVVQGLELLDILAEEEDDIYDFFDLSQRFEPTDLEDFELLLPDVRHRLYIMIWIGGKLASLEVDWAIQQNRLNLRSGYLTVLPDNIGNMTNLEHVDLRKNYLTDLPQSMAQLTKVTELNLDKNRFTTIPQCIGGMVNLQKLLINTIRY